MLNLVGDIGGTHTRLELVQSQGSLFSFVYSTQQYSSLDDILIDFIARSNTLRPISICVLGLPGCVRDNKVSSVNISSWGEIDGAKLGTRFCFERTVIFNDLEIAAIGLSGIDETSVTQITSPEVLLPRSGARLLVGVGTGLGVAFVTAGGEVVATESGWRSFAPRCDEDIELLKYLRTYLRVHRVGIEQVTAGPAVVGLYNFYSERLNETCSLTDPADIFNSDQSAAVMAVAKMSYFLGQNVAEICVQLNCTGGVFLTGGVVDKLNTRLRLPFLKGFTESLWNKALDEIVTRCAVFAVKDSVNLALLGAKIYMQAI